MASKDEDSIPQAPARPSNRTVPPMNWPLSVLFVTLLVIFVYMPIDIQLPISLFALMFSVILVAAVWAVRGQHRFLVGAVVLAILSVSTGWAVTFIPDPPLWLEVLTQVCAAVFVLYTIVALLERIVHQSSVNIHTISAGLSLYLLIGIFFGLVYTVVQILQPSAFASAAGELEQFTRAVDLFPVLLYFSFMALTTLGLGDIYPTIPLTRSIAILEAIAGQIYLVVMLALLVSTFAAQRMEREK